MKRLFSNTMKCYRVFFIPFIDGLSKTQNGEETSTYENIIKSSDTTIGELLTGAIVGFVALSLAGSLFYFLQEFLIGGFIFVAFLTSGCNGYSGLGELTNMVFSSFFESLLCSTNGNKDITKY